jgi:hypothetical protein
MAEEIFDRNGKRNFITSSGSGPAAQKPVGSLGVGSILLSLAVVSVPLALFSGALLTLVVHFPVVQPTPPFSDLQLTDGENYEAYYYVNFPSTRLVFIASWSSSIAPTLVSFLMALSLFPTAKTLYKNSKLETGKRLLPTPCQVGATILVPYSYELCKQILIQNSSPSFSIFLVVDSESCGHSSNIYVGSIELAAPQV